MFLKTKHLFASTCCIIIFCLFVCFLLQSKEADLQAIEQVLSNPELTSDKFRQWKEANALLIHEICLKDDHEEAPEAVEAAEPIVDVPFSETSL